MAFQNRNLNILAYANGWTVDVIAWIFSQLPTE